MPLGGVCLTFCMMNQKITMLGSPNLVHWMVCCQAPSDCPCLRFSVLSVDFVHVTNCFYDYHYYLRIKVKKVRTLDIVPLCETPPQKRSGMARVLKGSHSFTCTPTRSSAIGMSHTCLCHPSYSWYSFTDPGGMEDWVGLVAGCIQRQFTCRKAVTHTTTNRAQCRATALIETNALPLQ